jgi:Flp pilus assembly protein TadB
MKEMLKTKIMCLTVGLGLLLSSCGTSHDAFSKRKYTKGHVVHLKNNFNNSEGKSVTENMALNTDLERQDVQIPSKSKCEEYSEDLSTGASTALKVAQLDEQQGFSGFTKKESSLSMHSTGKKKEASANEPSSQERNTIYSIKKEAKKMAPQPKKDSGFIRTLMTIILVICVIMLLQLLFPGLIGNLISILFLALLVFLILRIFGVV